MQAYTADVRQNLGVAHHVQSELYNKRIYGDYYKQGDLVWPALPLEPP